MENQESNTAPEAVSRLLITLCTYNECENLVPLVHEILAVAPDAEILVVDDNSPDGTGQLADELAQQDPRVHVLHRPQKDGLGRAILAGFRHAITQKYDLLINMDADFSHHPRHLPALRDAVRDVDVSIGSRYVPGGGVVGWNWTRHLMSRGINFYARCLLGLKTQDNSGSYRCYRVSMLSLLDLDLVISKGYAFQEEILYRCRRAGCRFAETPILFEDRRAGMSKISRKEVFEAAWVIARLGWQRLIRKRVLRNIARSES